MDFIDPPSDPELIITLNEKEENAKYRKYLKRSVYPIFLLGETIQGHLIIDPGEKKKLKSKEVNIRLVAQFIYEKSIVHEEVIDKLKFPGALYTQSTQLQFVFEKPRISQPSYHGNIIKLTYFISVTFVKTFSDLEASQRIIILDPCKCDVDPGKEILVKTQTEFGHFDLSLSKVRFATFENIRGSLKILSEIKPTVQAIYIILTVSERIRLVHDSKSHEVQLCKYQLVDGSPHSGQVVPFIFPISNLRLWTAKQIRGGILEINYKLDLYVVEKGKAIFIKSQPIFLYFPEVSLS